MKKQKDYAEKLLVIAKNKQPFKIDLKNGVILDIQYDESIKNYRGYWQEENMYIGVWDVEFLYKCILEDYDEFEIIL